MRRFLAADRSEMGIEMKTLVLAQTSDLNVCNAIINMGKEFQKEQGFIQWTDCYPNIEIIKQDIQTQKGYVIKIENRIAGYMCIDFDGEPAYNNIQGKWNTKEPYAVVHRMAFSKEFRGMGLSEIAFALIEKLCLSKGIRNIRVDTDLSNQRMQHIFEKCGFSKCGIITFQGSGKLAYDKTL